MAIHSKRLIALAAGVAAVVVAALGGGLAASSPAASRSRTAATAPTPPRQLTGHRLRASPGAVAPGTAARSSDLFTDRVFANRSVGFALANDGSAQYPARSLNGGRSWRIAGPQFHIDAADGAAGVGYVGLVGPRTLFAYGSSVVDVTSNGGRTWWATYLGELVVAVVPGPGNDLVAYVQQQLAENSGAAATWQYVSRDGGRHWHYSTAFGG